MGTVKSSFGPWSAEDRNKSMKKTKQAIKDGHIPPAINCSCSVCGRIPESARHIDYHNMNYDDPVNHLIPLCKSCHLKLHSLIKVRLLEQVSKDDLIQLQTVILKEMSTKK